MKANKARVPWIVWASALFVFVFTNLFSWFIFDHVPHINDEIAQLFQAKIFVTGRVSVPSPCARENFDFTHTINNGRWYSQYPPGHPMLLTAGLLFNAPWLINPLLAALGVFLFYFLGREVFDRRIGILASLLSAVSIWYLVMSSSMMSHTPCMFFLCVFMLFIFRSQRRPNLLNGCLAGIGLGMAFIIRPQSAVFFSLPFLVYWGVLFLRSPRLRWKNVLGFGLLALCFLGVFLGYNQATNGHPLKMGYEVSHGPGQGLGFGKSGYQDIPHSAQRGSGHLGLYLQEMNSRMFGWPLSSFLGLIPLVLAFRFERESSRKDLLLLSGFFSLFISLFFYWGTSILLGARLVFEALPVFFLLTARGTLLTFDWLGKKYPGQGRARAQKWLAAVLAVMVVFAFSFRLPRWIKPDITEWYSDILIGKYERVNPAIHTMLKNVLPDNSLVVMKFLYHPMEYFPHWWWGSGFQNNGPKLQEPLIYAAYLPDNVDELRACYPDRNIFLFYGTLEKAMLLPVSSGKWQVQFDKALPARTDKRGRFELVKNPTALFTLYSREFSNFVSSVFSHKDFTALDVKYLLEQGNARFSQRDFQEAAFYYEAALQIEKAPREREVYLNMLSKTYFKLGQIAEARAISDRLGRFDDKKYYHILPERGI